MLAPEERLLLGGVVGLLLGALLGLLLSGAHEGAAQVGEEGGLAAGRAVGLVPHVDDAAGPGGREVLVAGEAAEAVVVERQPDRLDGLSSQRLSTPRTWRPFSS